MVQFTLSSSYGMMTGGRDFEELEEELISFRQQVLDIMGAKPDYVRQTHEALEVYKAALKEHNLEDAFQIEQERINYREQLIRRDPVLRAEFTASPHLKRTHSSLQPITILIQDIESAETRLKIQGQNLKNLFPIGALLTSLSPLKDYYARSLDDMLGSPSGVARYSYLRPQIQVGGVGIKTHLLSEDMARRLVLCGQYGENLQENAQGSHQVFSYGGIHFKKDGHPHIKPGLEAAMYGFYRGLVGGKIPSSTLVALKQVPLKVASDPKVQERYTTALLGGISQKDFFKKYPLYKNQFREEPHYDKRAGTDITVSSTDQILTALNIQDKQETRDLIREGKINGPLQALEELEYLEDQQTRAALLLETGKVVQRTDFLERLIGEKDFDSLAIPKQQSLLRALYQREDLRRLKIQNSAALNDRILLNELQLQNLTELTLLGCPNVTSDFIETLAERAPGLMYLTLINMSGIKRLSKSIYIIREERLIFLELRTLKIKSNPEFERVYLGAPKVTSIDLSNNPKLSRLRITAPQLETLNLQDTPVLQGDIDIKATKIKHLNLERSSIQEDALDAVIQQNPYLTELKIQEASHIYFREVREKHPFLTKSDIENLEEAELELAGRWKNGEVPDEEKERTYKELLERAPEIKLFAPHLPSNLKNLDLGWNIIGAEGVRALAPRLPAQLTSLDLGSSSIEKESMKALGPHLCHLSQLTRLKLGGSWSMEVEDVQELGLHLRRLSQLASLSLEWNNIKDRGVKFLVHYLPKQLKNLNLGCNLIGDAGVQALAAHLPQTLTSLNLMSNEIGDAGAQALAASLPQTLIFLNLLQNKIEDEGRESIRRAWGNRGDGLYL